MLLGDPSCQRLRRSAALEAELVVILVCADPEPVILAVSLARESAVAAPNFGGVYCGFLAKA
jgi:chorismate-pyruvate lyase